MCTKVVSDKCPSSARALCWWRAGVFLAEPGSSDCCWNNMKTICDFLRKKNNLLPIICTPTLRRQREIDCWHFFKALWNMQTMLHLMIAHQTNIIRAHMGNDVCEDLKVPRKKHERGFNVSSPGTIQTVHRGCSMWTSARVSDGEPHMAGSVLNCEGERSLDQSEVSKKM